MASKRSKPMTPVKAEAALTRMAKTLVKKPIAGLHVHRLKDNPEEKVFAEAWAKENGSNADGRRTLEWLLGPGNAQHPVTERDHVVAATVIQWLGSEVGQHFLESLGYKKTAASGDICTKDVSCKMMARALDETEAAAVGAGLERFISLRTWRRGVAYRTGRKPSSSLLMCNNCPWCGGDLSGYVLPKKDRLA